MINTTIQKTVQNQQTIVMSAIQNASARTGVDFAYLVEKAGAESSFNPAARSKTSSATGLYQFIDQTWLDMVATHGQKHGLSNYAAMIDRKTDGRLMVHDARMKQKILNLRNDPKIAALMAGEYAAGNKKFLEGNVGGDIGSTELYLAHFLGPHGAGKFIRALRNNPDAKAASVFPSAARANKNVFYDKKGQARSLQEVHTFFAKKFDGTGNAAVAQNTTPAQTVRNTQEENLMDEKVITAQILSGFRSQSAWGEMGRMASPLSFLVLSALEDNLSVPHSAETKTRRYNS